MRGGGNLSQKAAICRAPNTLEGGACRTRGVYGRMARQCRIALPTRMHANINTMQLPFSYGPSSVFQGVTAIIYAPAPPQHTCSSVSQARTPAMFS